MNKDENLTKDIKADLKKDLSAKLEKLHKKDNCHYKDYSTNSSNINHDCIEDNNAVDYDLEENSIITDSLWLELKSLNLMVNNILNGSFHISISTSSSLVLEFKNLNKENKYLERMKLEIRESYIKINFNIVVNLEDFILAIGIKIYL